MPPWWACCSSGHSEAEMSDITPIYERLCKTMPTQQKQGMDYITGEQCIRRLNEVLGVNAWDFEVKRIWFDREADCVLCIGKLTINWPDGLATIHEDIGSQIPNRKRDGSFVELGSDFKGARTDCLKRCAADIGVALWLYHKPEPGEDAAGKAAGKPGAGAQPTTHSAPSPGSAIRSAKPPDEALRAAWAEWQTLMTRLDRYGVEHGVPHQDATVAELRKGIDKYRPLADQAERDMPAVKIEADLLPQSGG